MEQATQPAPTCNASCPASKTWTTRSRALPRASRRFGRPPKNEPPRPIPGAVAEEATVACEELSASVKQGAAHLAEITSQAKSLGDTTRELGGFITRFGSLAHNSRGETFCLSA